MLYQTNHTYRMKIEDPKNFYFEMGPIRPPSEGQDRSLLIRATRNCPWNRCEFCISYNNVKFEYRKVDEIKKDIDIAKSMSNEIEAAFWRFGYEDIVQIHNPMIKEEIVTGIIRAILNGNSEFYTDSVNREVFNYKVGNLDNIAHWLASGGKTCFLQDADTLIMRTPELIEVIKYLKENFSTLERITSYARAKTCAKKSLHELKDLHKAGLSRLHIGLESGCDEVLEFIQKGVTAEEHILGGKKVVESGICLSEYVMPGLGGRKLSEVHALETARVLNEINADFIRLRSLIICKNSALFDKRGVGVGQFDELSEDEVIDEIEIFIENLNCSSYVVSDHMSNLLPEVEGQLPGDKEKILEAIKKYKNKSAMDKLEYRLRCRLQSYLGVYGQLQPKLNQKVQEALESIQKESSTAEIKTNQAISAIKDGFI